MLISLSALIAPPKYTNSIACLYTWPAALMVNDTFSPRLVCRHMISVLDSETVSPNAEHAVTITVTVLSNPYDDRDTMPASSAYSIPHDLCTSSSSFPRRPSTLPVREVPFFSPFSFHWSYLMLSMMAASAGKHFSATRSTAVKNMLNSSGASTHPWLRPCPTSNVSEHSPSSNRMHACMPSWNWRMTASIHGGTPKGARTSHRRVRSTESCFGEVDRAQVQGGVIFPPQFLQSSYYEHRVNRRGLRSESTLFLRQNVLAFALVTQATRYDFEEYFAGVSHEGDATIIATPSPIFLLVKHLNRCIFSLHPPTSPLHTATTITRNVPSVSNPPSSAKTSGTRPGGHHVLPPFDSRAHGSPHLLRAYTGHHRVVCTGATA